MSFLSPSPQRIALGIDLSPLGRLRDRRQPNSGPDQIALALLAQDAGADVILLDLSEWSERHDPTNNLSHASEIVHKLLKELTIAIELTLPLTQSALKFAMEVAPDVVRFIDSREGTINPAFSQTESEIDALAQQRNALLHETGICEIAPIGAAQEQVRAAHRSGMQGVEISAADYVMAANPELQAHALEALSNTAQEAVRRGLRVQIAGALEHRHIPAIAAIDEIRQINVGYPVAVRALTIGWQQAVHEFKAVIAKASSRRQGVL